MSPLVVGNSSLGNLVAESSVALIVAHINLEKQIKDYFLYLGLVLHKGIVGGDVGSQ